MFYIGFIPTKGKQAAMPFKNKNADELFSREDMRKKTSYAGVLAESAVLVDLDDQEEADVMLTLVREQALHCRVIKTDKGAHFLFFTDKPQTNRTRVKLAVGLTADIKGGGKASYEVLKLDGREREVIYDNPPYQTLPAFLTPVKTTTNLFEMEEGEGRNSALFSYILTLQRVGLSVEDCRETIRLANQYVLKDPLGEQEIETVLRDSAFKKPAFFNDKGTFLFDKFAHFLLEEEHIKMINGRLHVYRDGVYIAGDDVIEAAMIKHIPNLNRAKRAEVLSYLGLLVQKESGTADANLIAFNNGLLDITDPNLELKPFNPDYVITNKIPHNYVKGAKSDLLEFTMERLGCKDPNVINLLYEAVGYTFFRRNELRKSFFLLGEKRNGKSTFLDMVATLLGESNISNLDLCEIGDRFRTAELAGVMANIGDDINDEWISNTAIFKKVVSGDVITAERKGKDPFKLRSHAKFFFSANALPRLGRGKDSQAILDRLVIIPFDAKFTKADPGYDPFIKYKLREEPVMEALIAKSVPALIRVISDQEFTTSAKVKRTIAEFERSNNPILEFYDELDEDDYLHESVKTVYQRYVGFCGSNNLRPVSAIDFRKCFKAHFDLKTQTMIIDGKKVIVYETRQD